MTTPAPPAGPAQQGPPPKPERAELARVWAKALISTAYVPASRPDIEHLLRDLLDRLVGSLVGGVTDQGLPPDAAREVGVRLVAAQFTSEQSLSRTMELLGQALPALPELQDVDRLTGKVISMLGAVAAGFAAALRVRTLDQQEQVKRALLLACQDAERGLRVSEAKFREVFTSSAVGIAISDLDGVLVQTNQALGEILGDPGAELAGRSVYELLHSDDVSPLRRAYQELVTGSRTRFRLLQRFRLIDKDGEPAWTYLAGSLLHNADGAPTHQVTIVQDVTELHLLGERLSHQSLHDALTGLPNQQFFVTSLERALGAGDRITVYSIDLDSFAVINDAFGRHVGDRLLRRVAERLQSVVVGEEATVARFGANRFAILIVNSPTTPDVATLAARINSELAEPTYLDGHGTALSCGIGVAVHEIGGNEPAEELLRAAETALHEVKSSSKRQWGLFDPRRDGDHRARCRLAAGMPGAWENGEVGLDYQPMARLSDGSVVAVQALLRWDHPQRGPLPHQECLDLATLTGLALSLGQWMLHHAAEQFASWRVTGPTVAGPTVAGSGPLLHIDLTPQHAHDPDLVTTVGGALDRAGLAASCLRLGMPASALSAEQGEATENLQILADLGVAIAMLGCSGAGAVAHLEDLPVGAVELAPQIVRRVAVRGCGSAVARSVPSLVEQLHASGATVMVRGLDTRDQAEWWQSAGADVGQGAYFAPPGPPEAIVAPPPGV